MATLSFRQLAAAVQRSRWPDSEHATVVAICMAESTGQADVQNATGHKGLMQISPLHVAILASGDWRNPVDNMNMGWQVWKQQGYGAWVTYTNGVYKQYLTQANNALGNPAKSLPTSSGVTSVGITDDIQQEINLLMDPHTWKRVGLVIGGGLLLVYALVKITGTHPAKALARVAITRRITRRH